MNIKRKWDWQKVGYGLWTAESPDGSRYWVRIHGGNYSCEDSFGGVWGFYENPLSAMLAIENQCEVKEVAS